MARKRISNTALIAFSFLCIILIGAALLTLPVASRAGTWTSFFDALFTATSATCVTGLIVVDTCVHWSVFGQLVILTMIQIGGLGLMTVMASLALLMKQRIGLKGRQLLLQSSGNLQYGDLTKILKHILLGTVMFEGAGAVLLSFRFCPQMGFVRGVYNAVFHAVSAFCNAGFDLMGKYQPFGSMMGYAKDPLVMLTLASLIIIGGIGFIVWEDVLTNGIHLKRYCLHSKIVLATTAALLFGGAALFFITEKNGALAELPLGKQLLVAFFQSTTTRTAGFDAIGQAQLSNAGSIVSVVLMLIGGSPGSTAGGMKTMTVAVTVLTVAAIAKNRKDTVAFRRRVGQEQVRQALGILAIYATIFLSAVTLMSMWEPKGLTPIVFEAASAIATVGLSFDGSATFLPASQVVLMLLMYVGRIGGLSLVLMLAEKQPSAPLDRPQEKILIG